jgi:hypothetical protein
VELNVRAQRACSYGPRCNGVVAPWPRPQSTSTTVNSAHCTEMHRTFLEPDLQRLGVQIQALWFQQGEVISHSVRTVVWVLNEMFPARVIPQ